MGMVGEACLPSNAYYPRTPDYTLCSGVHVCWSEHSDSSFVYWFMILDYGFGTMTATTYHTKGDILNELPSNNPLCSGSCNKQKLFQEPFAVFVCIFQNVYLNVDIMARNRFMSSANYILHGFVKRLAPSRIFFFFFFFFFFHILLLCLIMHVSL